MEREKVISVENISKCYRLGLKEKSSDTFAGSVIDLFTTPFRNYKRIRNLSNLNKEEDSLFWALKNVSFDVKRGEVVGVIGHNGAGKSTLLKILSEITEPSSGQVVIRGKVSSLLEVGTGFHPELSGRENVYMNGTILGMTKKEINVKFDEIVSFSGVEKHIDTPVKFYSSGMKVRLAFSVAAHLEPQILIIDEVLAVGDFEFQRKCLGKMEDVATQGRTVLFVSHNMAAVRSLCSRAILLHKGEIGVDDSVETAINKYLSSVIKINTIELPLNSVFRNFKIISSSEGYVVFGEDTVFEIDVAPAPGEDYRNCKISLGIFNMHSELVVPFRSFLQHNEAINISRPMKIRILWERPNILPGKYFVKLAITSVEEGVIFSSERLVDFDIILSDSDSNFGKISYEKSGVIIPFVKWIIKYD